MKIKMTLLSDTIFGDGMSIPGAEDISVLHDECGFPYYKGSTFKGIFRDEMEHYIAWTDGKETSMLKDLLGNHGDNEFFKDKIIFSDFRLSDGVKCAISDEIGDNPEIVLESLTNLRAFTAMDEKANNIVKPGSLRMARCVNKGLVFYSDIICNDKSVETDIENVLALIKYIGSMRNRGFGKVKIQKVQ